MKTKKGLLARTRAELTRKADKGLLDLVYFDGSGFNLWAKVVYAWQKRGERIVIPVSKGKSQNVLGFMWHRCQRFSSFVFEGAVDANSHFYNLVSIFRL